MSFEIKVDARGLDLDLDKETVDIRCPECGATNKVSLGQIRREEVIKCHSCHSPVQFVDKDHSVAKAIDNVQKSMKNLKKTIEKVG